MTISALTGRQALDFIRLRGERKGERRLFVWFRRYYLVNHLLQVYIRACVFYFFLLVWTSGKVENMRLRQQSVFSAFVV